MQINQPVLWNLAAVTAVLVSCKEDVIYCNPLRMRVEEMHVFSPRLQAWERLEKAEHERELALRNELIRQEKLEQLARRFDRKAAMRETWLSENQRLVSQVLLSELVCVTKVIPRSNYRIQLLQRDHALCLLFTDSVHFCLLYVWAEV